MDYVVVYLTHIKTSVVVPEHYIYDLNLKALKNRGNNACRDHLVYWSNNCIQCEFYPEPNLNAVKTKVYSTADEGAWYHARTIYFTGQCTFDYIFIGFILFNVFLL